MSKEHWQGVTAVVDAGWGDNGKGKLVDMGSEYVDIGVRFSGGDNAGHTVKNHLGEFAFHLMPSSIFESVGVIAGPVVVNPDTLLREMKQLRERGVNVDENNLLISPDVTLILDWHKQRDALREVARGAESIGTTGRGIGPSRADHVERSSIKLKDLYRPDFEDIFMKEFVWQSRLTRLMKGEKMMSDFTKEDLDEMTPVGFMQMARDAMTNSPFDYEDMLGRLHSARAELAPHMKHIIPILWNAYKEGKNIMGEGAQGSLLDNDLGTTPFVTSSHPTRAGFSIATGLYDMSHVYAALRAYGARVGGGPMPTELFDDVGDHLVNVGHEFGTTTGRRRRTGWFDAVASHWGARASGATEMAITKLDVLDGLPKLNICVGYEVDGAQYMVGEVPTMSAEFLERAKPLYEEMDGWDENTSTARTMEDLPENAQAYIYRIEDLLDVPVRFVSVGPEREAIIAR